MYASPPDRVIKPESGILPEVPSDGSPKVDPRSIPAGHDWSPSASTGHFAADTTSSRPLPLRAPRKPQVFGYPTDRAERQEGTGAIVRHRAVKSVPAHLLTADAGHRWQVPYPSAPTLDRAHSDQDSRDSRGMREALALATRRTSPQVHHSQALKAFRSHWSVEVLPLREVGEPPRIGGLHLWIEIPALCSL